MPLHYFLCDLKDDDAAIAAYENYHAPGSVWPEIIDSIRTAGISSMQIFRTGNRLLMVMETGPDFDAGEKARSDANNATVQQWELLMDRYQQHLPHAAAGVKWVPMRCIFDLSEHPRT